ncbi:MAG: LTA synthase family protein [Bacteroidales bacterium]|nr:LTA synthase family protein [Bacteroidales bacterium]
MQAKRVEILQVFKSFIPWILTSIYLVLFLRVVETIGLSKNHIIENLFFYEALGLILDVFLIGVLHVFLFIIYFFVTKISLKIANLTIGIILTVLAVSHTGLLFYFFQMFFPLNQSLLGYSMQEIVFTVRTSNVNYTSFYLLSIGCVFVIVFFFRILKIKMPLFSIRGGIVFLFFCLIFSFFIPSRISLDGKKNLNYNLIINKSYYFYQSALNYKMEKNNTIQNLVETHYKHFLFPKKEFISEEYPLLSKTNEGDVLQPFFKENDSLPNIVIILVEGLGNRFIGNYLDVEFMPFLSDLASKSLYWKNVLSTTERSYGAIPSILASTPYAEKGFTFTNSDLYHFSLINILGKYDYYSTFFYGQPSWFDQAKDFFNRNGINRIEHAYTFPEKYKKIMVDDYFWGYDDKDLVRRILEVIDSLPISPRIDFIYTGSMHPPFIISEKEKYDAKINAVLNLSISKKNKQLIKKYKDYFASILFTDDALNMLINGYRQRPEFENTIFIITGDHNMSHIPMVSELEKYHVPLIIYSSLLKQPKVFHSVNSHLDIVPTLLSFLSNRNHIDVPAENAFIGKILDTCTHFRNLQAFIFMTQGRLTTDILFEDYFLSQKDYLYKVDSQFQLQPLKNDSIKSLLNSVASDFTLLNKYVCNNNKLISEQLYRKYADINMVVQPFQYDYQINKQTEFYNIIHQQALQKTGFYYFDFSAKQYTSFPSNIPHLVVEVRNTTTNESILWESLNFIEKNGKIHFLFSIDTIKPSDNLLFSAYFWNEQKGTLSIISGNSSLYRLGR